MYTGRYEQIAEGQLPHIAKPRTQDKGGKDQVTSSKIGQGV
jgi:hypothetical protein